MIRFLLLAFVVLAVSTASAQDFWRLTYGPPNMGVRALALDSSGNVFALASGTPGNFYRSSDDGRTWTFGNAPAIMSSIAVSRQGDLWAVYNTTARVQDTVRNGLWHSSDNGQTWDSVLLRSSKGLAVAVDPDGGVLFANDRQFRYSTDKGLSWTSIAVRRDSALHPANQVQTIAVRPDGRFFIGTLAGPFMSTDKGATWIPLGQSSAPRKVLTFAAGPNALYVGSDSALFTSTDEGTTWTKIAAITKAPSSITIRSESEIYVSTSSGTIYHSINGGHDWSEHNVNNALVRQVLVTRQGDLLAASLEFGLFRSADNGRSWESSRAGMYTSTIDAMAVAPDGTLFAAGGAYVFKSGDMGGTWRPARLDPSLGPVYGAYCMAALPNGDLYVGAFLSGIYRSTDNGETWQQVNNGLKNTTIRSLMGLPNGNVLAGTEVGLYISTDHGNTWKVTSENVGEIWALTTRPDGAIFAGFAGGRISYSLDGGVKWSNAKSNITSDIQTFASTSDGSMYAGTYTSGLYRSTDAGLNWSKVLDGPSAIMTITTIGADEIYLGGYRGIRRSTDAGKTWDSTAANMGIGRVEIPSLVRDSTGYLYAATHGLGVARSIDRVAAGIGYSDPVPSSPITLGQNLPNPVSVETVIPLSVRDAGNASLRLYDIRGDEVMRIFDGNISADKHDVRIDCSHLAAGIYRYELRMNGMVVSHSLIVTH